MGMIEISERKREHGGVGRAIKDFKESLECLKEDFYAVMDELEEFGERDGGGSYGGGGSRGGSMGYRDEYRRWRDNDEEDEEFGERRGVKGSGRRRRSNGRYY